MIRRPTPHEVAYHWHTEAMRGIEVDYFGDDPQPGWYKRRLVKDGPFVPAKIWLDQCIDPATGELVADEELLCEVDGQWADAEAQWTWLARTPISEAEYTYMTARRAYAAVWSPDDPAANPHQAVDWLRVPVPRF